MKPLRDVKLRPDRVKFLKARGHLFYKSLTRKRNPSLMEQLALKVMEHGGVAFIVPTMEPDVEVVIRRGELFDGKNRRLVKGKPCQCHTNSAWYWSDHDDKVQLVTGYALSEDGVWRSHSWCVEINSSKIVETTTGRALYFGVRFTADEAETFLFAQTA